MKKTKRKRLEKEDSKGHEASGKGSWSYPSNCTIVGQDQV